MFFRQGALFESLSSIDRFDVLAGLELNTWQGRSEVRLKIEDLRLSKQ